MSKEALLALDRDAERLLFAGAQVARGDGDLASRKAVLQPLAAKNPTFGKVVEQIDKVQKSTGKAAGTEVLNLAALTAVVRGALAAPAPAVGDLTPLPKTEPIESPLAPSELGTLVGALAGSREVKRRYKVIEDACERDTVRDLRILPFAVAALGAGDWGVSNAVQEKLLPKLGSLVVGELRDTLKIKGGGLDVRKLTVLVSIEKKKAQPLVLEAIEKGSPDMRASALPLLAELDPAAVEPIALKLLASDKADGVKRASISALAEASSDEALEALLKVFQSSDNLRGLAGSSLSTLKHKKATERVLALLSDDLLKLTNFKPGKDLKGKAKTEDEKKQREFWSKVQLLNEIVDVLASRSDDKTTEAVLSIYRTHKVEDVKNAAARALLRSGYEGAFDELSQSVIKADWRTQSEFVEAIFKRDPLRAYDRLSKFLDPKSFKTKNHTAFANQILNHIDDGDDEEPTESDEDADEKVLTEEQGAIMKLLQKDPRWIDLAIVYLDNADLMQNALGVLGKIKSTKALDAILKLLGTKKAKNLNFWYLSNALQKYRDPRVGPALVKLLDDLNGFWARRSVYNALQEMDEPASGPLLRAWYVDKKRLDKREKEEVEAVLARLERDRALTG